MFALNYARRFISLSHKYHYFPKYVCYNLRNSHVENKVQKLNRFVVNCRSFSTSQINYFVPSDNLRISDAFLNLDTNYKQEQRIYKNDVELLLKEIENEAVVNEDKAFLLLQCCGSSIPDESSSTRIALAQQVWQTFINKNIELNVEHYNALLQCYVENRMALSHKEFLSNMKCEPNEQTYDLLLECVCENGDISQAIEIVNIMKEKGLSANEPVFNSLILCHLRRGDHKSAQNILDTMRIAHMNPSSFTYTALLRGYAEAGDLNQFKKSLYTAVNATEFSTKQLITILHSVCISESIELLPLLKKVWSSVIDSRSFETKLSSLCIHLIHMNKPLIAYELFKCLVEPEVGFISESDTYGAFLFYEMVRSDTPAQIIIKIADDLIKTNRNTLALFKATEIALRVPTVKLSLEFLHALHERNVVLRNHYFWPILIHEAKQNGESGIFEIFKIMLNYNLRIDFDTLEMYSLQYIKNLDPDILISRLKQFNLTATDVITPICVVLLRENKLREVANLTSKYKVRLDGNKIVKTLVSALTNSNDVKSAVTIIKNIQSKNPVEDWAGQFISLIFTRSRKSVNYQQILSLLKLYKTNEIHLTMPLIEKIEFLVKRINDNDTRLDVQNALYSLHATNGKDVNNYIPHPRDMNLEELECHLIELRDKKMETRGILRKLIQMHCRVGNVERVTQLCDEFDKAEYTMSPGMKSALLDLYIKSEQFEKAWKTYNDIKEQYKTFTVDEFKIVDLARLLKNNGRFNEAVKILKDESSKRKIRGGNSIEHNCLKLLETTAKSGSASETKTMLKTLVNCGYCIENVMTLNALIKAHLINNNLNDAVEEYLNCCVKYKQTPYVHELLCQLVQNQSTELIQKVVDATGQVQGMANSQMILAAALAETGSNKMLRKFFAELTTNLPSTTLEQYCQRWTLEGKTDAMHNLIASAQGIKTIDMSSVYLHLMRIYSSNNDCDSALSLWNDMQDNHINRTDKIKNIISALLSNQNHPMAKRL